MTKREAFKIGFLAKLASVGLTPSSFVELLEKRSGFGDLITGVTDPIKSVAELGTGLISGVGLPAAAGLFVGLPYVAGKATGALHSALTDVTPEDVERMKIEDFIGTYKQEANKIKQRLARSHWRDKLLESQPRD
jgi:hypothetical protein